MTFQGDLYKIVDIERTELCFLSAGVKVSGVKVSGTFFLGTDPLFLFLSFIFFIILYVNNKGA